MQFRPRLTVQLGLFDFLITGYCLLSPSSNLKYLVSCPFDTNSRLIFCTSSGHFCFHQTFPNVTFANCTVLYGWLSWQRIVRTVRFRCFEFSFLSKFILVRMRCPCVLIKLINGIIATWASRLISSSVQIPPNRGFQRKTQIVALPPNWHCNTQKRSLTLQLCLSNPRRSVVDFEFWSIVPISFRLFQSYRTRTTVENHSTYTLYYYLRLPVKKPSYWSTILIYLTTYFTTFLATCIEALHRPWPVTCA